MTTRKKLIEPKKKATSTNLVLYGLSAFFVVAAIAIITNRAQGADHPTPRAEANTIAVMDGERYADAPHIAETYKMSADIRSTLDGLFCYCYCHEGHGHYSLLDCFRDDHGAGCDVCIESVNIAHRMLKEGKTLDQIRAQLDTQFGKG